MRILMRAFVPFTRNQFLGPNSSPRNDLSRRRLCRNTKFHRSAVRSGIRFSYRSMRSAEGSPEQRSSHDRFIHDLFGIEA
jgi:hypothetical protein